MHPVYLDCEFRMETTIRLDLKSEIIMNPSAQNPVRLNLIVMEISKYILYDIPIDVPLPILVK